MIRMTPGMVCSIAHFLSPWVPAYVSLDDYTDNAVIRHTNIFLLLLVPLKRSQRQLVLETRASMAWRRSQPRLSHTSPLRFKSRHLSYCIIAYCLTVQVRFALSLSAVFSRTDTVTDSERFYDTVLDLFEDVEEQQEVNDLLMWWNR